MIKKILMGSSISIVAATFAIVIYILSQMSIEHLISCSTNESGTRIPSSLCEYFMVNHRITKGDLEKLSQGAGLDYILNGENLKKYKIAEIFIDRGLSVDGINNFNSRRITPLQAAVIHNDVNRVSFLIQQGADLNLKGTNEDITALELARKLQLDDHQTDRGEIIKILSAASSNKK